jgi:Cys-tRNA(Pro)/Cys-tRNA(Cys) deacylase
VTPAILLARKAAVPHDVLAYEHDPRAASYGLEAADLLGLDPATVFKTLVVDVEGVGLACAVVPVTGMLDLKAVAEALGGRRAKMAEQQAAERAAEQPRQQGPLHERQPQQQQQRRRLGAHGCTV